MYKPSTGAGLWSGQAVRSADQRVAAVFAFDLQASRRAILHLREGAPETPVWLYSTVPPPRELLELCDRVEVCADPLRLVLTAQRELWPRRAAIVVGAWTGGRGNTLLKVVPLLTPPFRALFVNASGDFLAGTPRLVTAHCGHRVAEAVHNGRVRGGEIARDLWEVVRHHIWRSGPVTRARDCTAAAALFLFATLLRWCAYPHRRIFARLHGDGVLKPDVAAPPPADSRDAVFFFQQDHHWDAAAIEKLADESNARWLVWHNGSGPGQVDDLLPMFDRPGTFAVSRQSSYRAWKPMLLPTAPFRTLQPGERTQVIAPLGSSIVVDLRKLASLGIPRVSHPLTAWMLLFWKAAAAGWPCYSAGQDAALAPQPDFPTEEAAFLLRVALDPACRTLAPRQPLLGRGNIAFSADHGRTERPSGVRLKVLVVSPFLPYPLSHGGAVRIYNLCRALSDRVDFALIAVRENHETVDYAKLHEVFREVYVIDLDETVPVSAAIPEQARQQECPSLRALISHVCRTWCPDLVQFEYTQTAALKDCTHGIPAILVEHDITYTLYRQLAEADPGRAAHREYRRWLAFEQRWLADFDAVWTVSESDRALAIQSGRRSPERTFAVPNGVDTRRFTAYGTAGADIELLYVGSFRHLPNILAFENLRDSIMPLVWARFPRAVLRVVAGPRHRYFWDKFDRPAAGPLDGRVRIHDFVEDLRPLYAQATVVVAPLAVSAGTNIKIMEAMACGKSIVSTPVGCAGLDLVDGVDLLVRGGMVEFAEAVCDLLADAGMRDRLGRGARETVEDRFSWAAIADEAYRSYRSLAGKAGGLPH